MKKISILVVIALMAIVYSCGNSGQGSKEQKTDSLATAKQVDNKQAQKGEQQSTTEQAAAKISDADLYKYFSKEEISKNMQNAVTILQSAKVDKDDPFMSEFPEKFAKLLKKDGWVLSPKQVVAKWGKPQKEEQETFDNPFGEKEKVHQYSYVYPHFEFSNSDWSNWRPGSLSTSTPGFGFAGVYVGIPECNKEFIEKLFAKAENIEKIKEDGVEQWSIVIFGPAMTELTLQFNDNGTVKSMKYFSRNYVD